MTIERVNEQAIDAVLHEFERAAAGGRDDGCPLTPRL
jgi:hypothetical protein